MWGVRCGQWTGHLYQVLEGYSAYIVDMAYVWNGNWGLLKNGTYDV